jgi:hypothetical protein
MVKKKPASKKKTVKKRRSAVEKKTKKSLIKKKELEYTTADVDKIEREVLKKANTAITAIENAVAVFDASEEKPQDLKIRIDRLRFFHDALSDWEKKMLKAIAKGAKVQERVQVLREFSDICYSYR